MDNHDEKLTTVQDVIVPIIAIPKVGKPKFRFLGSGFYIDRNGHILTCRHVVDSLPNDQVLGVWQIGKNRYSKIEVTKKSHKYDLALCDSPPPEISEPYWPAIYRGRVKMGINVEVFGYWHETIDPDQIFFRQRYMKGYVTGIPFNFKYSDSFELDFPILFGMSGSPVIYRSHKGAGIVGCAYGTHETEIVKHIISEENRISKIVELGLAYDINAILSLCQSSEISLNIISQEPEWEWVRDEKTQNK